MAGRFDVLYDVPDTEIDMNNVLESFENLKKETKGKISGKMAKKKAAQDNKKTILPKSLKISSSTREVESSSPGTDRAIVDLELTTQ